MFKDSTIFVTGGTGSFGKKFVQMTLEKFSPKRIIIYSRDEVKQWEMAEEFGHDHRISFVIGDIRDIERLKSQLKSVDFVVHAAATKIVPTAEYNPEECVKTNINGAINLIKCCTENKIKKVVALSTDKACNPVNLYGATKLASDKIFIAANSVEKNKHCSFSIVRYGNVIGSRGSVVPFFAEKVLNNEEIPITDKRMTRFMITLEQAVEAVWHAFSDMLGGEIYVRKIPSMSILDIATSVSETSKIKVIGIRPGEKLHEQMISQDDSFNTYEYENYYKILPTLNLWNKDPDRVKDGKIVDEGFSYSSESNNEWMSIGELQGWIDRNL